MKNCSRRASKLAFSSVSTLETTIRRTIRPPSGYEGFLSRRQAAAALGFASEFKVRRLEKEGRLRPIRGVMGSAWYARAQVLALRDELTAPPTAAHTDHGPPAPARWSDAQLIAHLRTRVRAIDGGAGSRPRTAVDLVAETGISIARAERVYRFWLTHDAHPVADEARGGGAPSKRRESATPAERRSDARIEREVLLQQMRAADPTVRAAAFEKLRALR